MGTGKCLSVWGAGGGHGASTVALVAAALTSVGLETTDLFSPEWVLGRELVPTEPGSVVDRGRLSPDVARTDVNLVVLRGPCMMSLRRLSQVVQPEDSVVVLREPWRVITNIEVSITLGIEVAFELPFSERVPRLADAGLLGARLDQLLEFKNLSAWLDIIDLHGDRAT